MTKVLVLFLFGAVNSASIFMNPPVAHGPVQHISSKAPSTEYMSFENLLGSSVTYAHDQAAVAQSVHISVPQAVIEEVAVAHSVKNADLEPYLVSGPVAEYVIPFGLNIPGIQFTDEGLLQPVSVPVKTAPVPKVVEYSFVPKTEPVVENYYKVDDGQLEMVSPTYVTYDSFGSAPVNPAPVSSLLNTFVKVDDGQLETVSPTYVTYDSFGSAPVNPAPVSSLLNTFVKVDDGQLERFNLLHVSNTVQELLPVYDQTPVVDTYAAPTLTDISDSIFYSAPEPLVFNSNQDFEFEFGNNPVLAISNMLNSFYTQENVNPEKITPTHVSYSIPEQVANTASLLTNIPVIKMNLASEDITVPVPIVKTKAKLSTKSTSSYKVEEVDADTGNVEVKIAEEEASQVEDEEETVTSELKSSNNAEASEIAEVSEGSERTEEGDEDQDAKTKSEGEENSGDEAEIKSKGVEEEEEKSKYFQTTINEEDSDEE